MTRTAVCIVLAPVLLVASPPQDERKWVPDHPGKIAVAVNHDTYSTSTRAESAAFDVHLTRLRDLLLSAPMFDPPRGVEVSGWLNVDTLEGHKDPRAPIAGTGYIQFYPYVLSEKTGVPVRFPFTTAEVNVWVNKPDANLEPHSTDARFYFEPALVRDAGGVAVYRRKDGDNLLIMTRGTRPPFVPVTREEFVTYWCRWWQKKAASSAGDPISPKIAAGHQAILDAMSADERRMAARFLRHANPLQPALAPVGGTAGQAIVKANPAWYDPTLPRTAIQLVTLRFQYAGDLEFERPESTDNVDALRVWQMLQTSDWRAIREGLMQK